MSVRTTTKDTKLVHRIKDGADLPNDGSTPNVDRCFRWDYMGSAEFEFGTLPAAWKRFKAYRDRKRPIVPTCLTHEGAVVWYVGVPEGQDMAERFVADQLGPRRWRLKERSALARCLRPEDDDDRFRAPIGWFAVDQVEPWALFAERSDADKFLVCAGLLEVG